VLATSLVLTLRAHRVRFGRPASAGRTQRVAANLIPATPLARDKSRARA
jgi:hypothetical protein